MKHPALVVGSIAVVLVLAAGLYRSSLRRIPPLPAAPAAPTVPEAPAAGDAHGFLYGRVTTVGGERYEGRLRFGGDQEAFWTDDFNGGKNDNPWSAFVPRERLTERLPIELFGLEVGHRERTVDLHRPFVTRFGNLARIDADRTTVRVTTKRGSVFVLDRFGASDFDDGVRVWDRERGAVDLETEEIRSIELLPAADGVGAPARLHGTVRTSAGELAGFVEWERDDGLATDTLDGRQGREAVSLPYAGILTIVRSTGGVTVTLREGGERLLTGSRETGDDSRGLVVDDPRFGRVLVSWSAFEALELDPPGSAGSGPGYEDFPPGAPLAGSLVTRSGRRLAGRLVFDLDESETTETLDAEAGGVSYSIPFGKVAAIARPAAGGRPVVTLVGGLELALDRGGDLGDRNGGLLVFADGDERPEYVPWSEVARIDF